MTCAARWALGWPAGGTSLPIIGRVLNHKTPEATKVYARLIVA
ncbi:MAG: hypothetical protein RJA09_833, partial [Pseudomonadota bacterium]